jgi:hypothetical protein
VVGQDHGLDQRPGVQAQFQLHAGQRLGAATGLAQGVIEAMHPGQAHVREPQSTDDAGVLQLQERADRLDRVGQYVRAVDDHSVHVVRLQSLQGAGHRRAQVCGRGVVAGGPGVPG